MAQRGRCRCGAILRFHKGPEGYKTRCAQCGSVVRLRSRSQASSQGKSAPDAVTRALPSLSPRPILPTAELPAARAIPCEQCGMTIPAAAEQCSRCGNLLIRTRPYAPALVQPLLVPGEEEAITLERAEGPPRASLLAVFLGWLAAVLVLLGVAGVVLVLLLWH
jgi:hypothetical protein